MRPTVEAASTEDRSAQRAGVGFDSMGDFVFVARDKFFS
jgi:hypothetical protein